MNAVVVEAAAGRGSRRRSAAIPQARRHQLGPAPHRLISNGRRATVTGHGLHFDAGGGEELTDLGRVLNDVQRHAADNYSEQDAVVSMGVREWLSGHLLGEGVKSLADADAAPI